MDFQVMKKKLESKEFRNGGKNHEHTAGSEGSPFLLRRNLRPGRGFPAHQSGGDHLHHRLQRGGQVHPAADHCRR